MEHLTVRTSRTLKIRLLSRASECDHCIQMLLPLTRVPTSALWRQFDEKKRRLPCLATALFSHSLSCLAAPAHLPTLRAPPELALFLWHACLCPSFLESSELWPTCVQCSAVPASAPPTNRFMALLMERTVLAAVQSGASLYCSRQLDARCVVARALFQ